MSRNLGEGPQYKGDDDFRRRMRLHQSWYRDQVLAILIPSTPKVGSQSCITQRIDAARA